MEQVEQELTIDDLSNVTEVFLHSKDENDRQNAEKLLSYWQSNENSILTAFEILNIPNVNRNLKFYAAQTVSRFIQCDFQKFSEENIQDIFRHFSSLVANAMDLNDPDVVKEIVVLADICLQQNEFIQMIEFPPDVLLVFFNILFEDARTLFINNIIKNRNCREFCSSIIPQVYQLLASTDISVEWFALCSNVFSFEPTTDIYAFLEMFAMVSENEEYFPYLIKIGESSFNMIGELCDQEADQYMFKVIQILLHISELQPKYGIVIFEQIFDFTLSLYNNNLELLQSILTIFFNNISAFYEMESEFKSFVDLMEKTTNFIIDKDNPIGRQYINILLEFIILVIDNKSDDEYKYLNTSISNLVSYGFYYDEFFMTHFQNPTNGLLYVLQFAKQLSIETKELIINTILGWTQIPASATNFFAQSIIFGNMEQLYHPLLQIILNHWQESPNEWISLLKLMAVVHSEFILDNFNIISSTFLPILSQIPIKVQSFIIIMFVILMYKGDNINLLPEIGNLILCECDQAIQSDDVEAILAFLKFLEKIIMDSAQLGYVDETLVYFQNLFSQVFAKISALGSVLNDTLQNNLFSIMKYAVSKKWAVDHDSLYRWTENCIAECIQSPMSYHFEFLAMLEIFPTVDLVKYILDNVTIQWNEDCIIEVIRYLECLIKRYPEEFWKFFSLEFILSFLDTHRINVRSVCLSLIKCSIDSLFEVNAEYIEIILRVLFNHWIAGHFNISSKIDITPIIIRIATINKQFLLDFITISFPLECQAYSNFVQRLEEKLKKKIDNDKTPPPLYHTIDELINVNTQC